MFNRQKFAERFHKGNGMVKTNVYRWDSGVSLYDTFIVRFDTDGAVRVNNGGWDTVSTRATINAVLNCMGIDAQVYHRKGEARIRIGDWDGPMVNDIKVN